MQYIQARLTPWAAERIRKDYGGVNKTALRKSLADFPGTEFHTIASVVQRGGACFTIGEVKGKGIELRYNDDRDVMVIEVHPSGAAVVR